MMNKILLILLFILLVGCSHSGRYQQKHDSTPTRLPKAHELKDAVPRDEPHSRGGNRNYTVRGKHYQVLKSAEGFKASGVASWYGKKFHGHLTSNGERYNMYAMSAAHKNLPLPTYVKVTNQANQKSVIVRVNDRGPFHQSRIIDLSYSAAYKLDMLKTGTANVTVETINANTKKPIIVKSTNSTRFIQVFATKHQTNAEKTATALKALYQLSTRTLSKNNIFKVQIGPIAGHKNIQATLEKIKQQGYHNAFVVNP